MCYTNYNYTNPLRSQYTPELISKYPIKFTIKITKLVSNFYPMDELKANKKGLKSIFNALSGSIPIPSKTTTPDSLTPGVDMQSRKSFLQLGLIPNKRETELRQTNPVFAEHIKNAF